MSYLFLSCTKNTKAYIDALNAQNYCGYSDWRMPNVEELSSIIDYGQDNPTINPIFINTSKATTYWTSQPRFAFNKSENAWNVHFYTGTVNEYGYKYSNRAIRAVRAGQ